MARTIYAQYSMVSLWWIHIIHIPPHILPLSRIGSVPRWHMGRACQRGSVGNTHDTGKRTLDPQSNEGRKRRYQNQAGPFLRQHIRHGSSQQLQSK